MNNFKKIRLTALISALLVVIYVALADPAWLNSVINSIVNSQPLSDTTGHSNRPKGLPNSTLIPSQTTNQLYKQIKQKYALKPDNRFIQAAIQIKSLVSEQPAVSAELKFHGGIWHIYLDQEKAGEIPEIPSFEQGLGFLSLYVDQLLLQHPLEISHTATSIVNTQLAGTDGFYPQKLTQNLIQLDQQWNTGEQSKQVLLAVLQNIVRMFFGTDDDLRFTEVLAGRAIALLVLSKTLLTSEQYELESQLAYRLGYRSHAQSISRELPENSAWKQFIRKDTEGLHKQLTKNDGAPEARYYLLKLYAASDDYAQWVTHMQQYYRNDSTPIHAMLSGYQLGRFDTFKRISRTVPAMIVDSTSNKNQWQKQWDAIMPFLDSVNSQVAETLDDIIRLLFQTNVKKQFEQFSALLDSKERLYTGPFLDKAVWRDYQKGFFVNSIYQHGMFNLDTWNNLQATEDFAELLKEVDDPDAQQLASLFKMLLKAEKSEATVNELLQLIQQITNYGPLPRLRIYEGISPKLRYGSSLVNQILPTILDNLDSRMETRIDYANMLRNKALYLSKAEQVYLSNLRDGGESSVRLEAWLARYFDEQHKLMELLEQKQHSASVIDTILGYIRLSELSNSQQDAMYMQLIQRYPRDWDIHNRYIDALEDREDYITAINIAESWLETIDQHSSTFDYYRAVIALSRNYRHLNQADDSEKIITSIVQSYYGPAFYEATKVYLHLENYDKALETAEIARKRYTTSKSILMNLVKVYWHRSDFRRAAELLQQEKEQLTVEDWHWKVGTAFVETFKGNNQKGIQAARALLDTDIQPISLRGIAIEIDRLEEHQIAFYILSNIKVDEYQAVYYQVDAYLPLLLWKGKGEALQWLNSQISPRWKNLSSMFMIENSKHELLWDFITEPELGNDPYMVWLVRAVAYVQNPEKEPEKYQKLLNYYHDQSNDNYYDHLGRMAMDIEPGDDLLNLTGDAKKLGEISYYKAIQEYGRGNYNRAADWFLVSVETGYERNGEYRWAYNRLYTWAGRQKSLNQQLELN